MKSLKKFISITLILSFPIILICCGKENYSETFKPFFPQEKNVVIKDTIKAFFKEDEDPETSSYTRFVLNTTDNRIQYVTEGSSFSSYVYEFKEDGVYSSKSFNLYEKVEDIPNLAETLDSSEINVPIVKGPLEVGTTWEGINDTSSETDILVYKIVNVDADTFTISTSLKSTPDDVRSTLVYRKGYGQFIATMYYEGKITTTLESAFEKE